MSRPKFARSRKSSKEKQGVKQNSYKIKKRKHIRSCKKLLVLDVDMTLINGCLKRPFLNRFLSEAYKNYEIGIWSASKMPRIRRVLSEHGLTRKQQPYKFCFVMCEKAMSKVKTKKGEKWAKPLKVVWDQFDNWSPKNTIMIDDKRDNFLKNPREGLLIKKFYHDKKDRELKKLTKYLQKIACVKDFRQLDHKKWEKY